MNVIRKLAAFKPCVASVVRRFETSFAGAGTEQKRSLVLEPLKERELVRVEGAEVVPFLQGLITNDMTHLLSGQSSAMYTMFLNKSGRVLYETIIYKCANPDTFLIECDKAMSYELRRHLRLYRVRRKIDIYEADKEFRPWVLYNESFEDTTPICLETGTTSEYIVSPDPRLSQLGMRVLAPPSKTRSEFVKTFAKPEKLNLLSPTPTVNYRLHRYIYGIGEGGSDLPPGQCFPMEANGDFLHGISFHKGCYLGQELTARVQHTGVVRKRLMPMRLVSSSYENVNAVQTLAGAKIGVIRGIIEKRALALLRVDQALSAPKLMIDGDPCFVEKPDWWPTELPKQVARQIE